MKTKKPQSLNDLDKFPIPGPHFGDQMRNVPSLYLIDLIGSNELKKYPEVAAYIERARRQLNAEAKREHEARWFSGH